MLCRHERSRPAVLAAPSHFRATRRLLLGLILLLGVSLAWHWFHSESFSLLRAATAEPPAIAASA